MTQPGPDYAFDDAGRPVPAVAFTDPFSLEGHELAELREQVELDTIRSVLEFAVGARRPISTGRRMLALAWTCGMLPDARRQRDLAALLKCSPGVACRLVREAKRHRRNVKSNSVAMSLIGEPQKRVRQKQFSSLHRAYSKPTQPAIP